jgi:hypothetical protein
MKTFQKIALVSAIAAAPFAAQADLTPMDDSLMGNTTGQAGVTIEIDLGTDGIKVGSVVYTDTAHDVDGTTLVVDGAGLNPGDAGYVDTYNQVSVDGGSVALENISVNLTGKLVQTIDVSANGDLEMTMSSPGSLSIAMGNDALDTAGDFSALKLVGGTDNDSEVINNLDMDINLGSSTTTIMNLGSAATVGLGPLSGADVVGAEYAGINSSMAIKMNASVEVTDMNLGLFGYTAKQGNYLVASKLAAGDGNATTTAATYLDAATGKLTAAAGATNLSPSQTAQQAAEALATGSAIGIEGVTVEAKDGGAIALNQVIWAVGGDASVAPAAGQLGAGVYIQLGEMDMNIGVEAIKIGGSSIGSLAVNGLELGGMTQRIYGH